MKKVIVTKVSHKIQPNLPKTNLCLFLVKLWTAIEPGQKEKQREDFCFTSGSRAGHLQTLQLLRCGFQDWCSQQVRGFSSTHCQHDLLVLWLRDMHGGGDSTVDRLTCPDCGKLFTSKRSLVGHKKEKHSGTLEIFPCQHCGKNFSRKSNLKAHMDSIHFGKKFPCSYCERIFTNRSCMNLHVKKIHSETLYNLW